MTILKRILAFSLAGVLLGGLAAVVFGTLEENIYALPIQKYKWSR